MPDDPSDSSPDPVPTIPPGFLKASISGRGATVYLNRKEMELLDYLDDEIWRGKGAGAEPPEQFESWEEAGCILDELKTKIRRARRSQTS